MKLDNKLFWKTEHFFSNKVASMVNIHLSKNGEFNKTELEIFEMSFCQYSTQS